MEDGMEHECQRNSNKLVGNCSEMGSIAFELASYSQPNQVNSEESRRLHVIEFDVKLSSIYEKSIITYAKLPTKL